MRQVRKPYLEDSGAPPATLAAANNLRQRARACGLNPNYWYIADHQKALKRGQSREVLFWKRPIVLFRGEDGRVRAMENRCAHRQVKLSAGTVRGNQIACMYHGWTYDEQGCLASVPHEDFGRPLPPAKVPTVPVRERYGMIWIFPGDPQLAEEVPLPEIPELEGPDAWPCVPVDFTWQGHHSMVLDNVSDYTHGWLHRKYEPFRNPKLMHFETIGDRVNITYDAVIGAGKLMSLFVKRSDLGSNRIDLCYLYPYHTSNTDDFIKHFISVLPIDEQTTRVFFLFYYRALKIPLTPFYVPKKLMVPLLKLGNRFIVRPVLDQDGVALALEQEGYNRAWDAPFAEMNGIVKAFQELTVRKWQQYLDSAESQAPAAVRKVEAAG